MPLAWVAYSTPVVTSARLALQVGLRPIAFVFCIFVLAVAVGALRWRVLLQAYDAPSVPPFLSLLRTTFLGLYFGLLPGAVGGDVVRAYRTRHAAGGLVQSMMVVFVDRLAGLFGLLALVAAFGFWGPPSRSSLAVDLTRSAAAIAMLLALLSLGAPWLPKLWPGLGRTLRRAPGVLKELGTLRPPRDAARLAAACGLSCITQAAVIGCLTYLVVQVSPGVEIFRVLQVAPLVVLLTFVPLTPLGIGQREVVFVSIWGIAGVSSTAALSASLLAFLVTVGVSSTGGLVVLLERSSTKAEPAPEPRPASGESEASLPVSKDR
ncbi:MAG: flippase-like domain-containing protein [Deltaproteobacteria bacterium]|nr:flippase-like domain-containing protein [Deltaproteobacteria bacterium]